LLGVGPVAVVKPSLLAPPSMDTPSCSRAWRTRARRAASG